MGAYVVFSEDETVTSAQQAESQGHPFWPLVRQGHFGELGCPSCALGAFGGEGDPTPKPLGILGTGSAVLLPAGAVVKPTVGSNIQLTALCRFSIGKATASFSNAADWAPSHTDVMFDKDVAITALDPIVGVPVPGAGGTFSANAGWHGTLPAGGEFTVVSAAGGSDARFAAVAGPSAARFWTPTRVGMAVAIASAIVVAGLFAATLTLGKSRKGE